MAGRGCGGDGGVGPTHVSYLRGVGATGGTRVGDTTVAAEKGVACPAAGGGATAATAVGLTMERGTSAAGSEDGLTRGL